MTLKGVVEKSARQVKETDLGLIENAALVMDGEQIEWIGRDQDLPKAYSRLKSSQVSEIKLEPGLVMPGFIECHTHTVFAGSRSAEFEKRLQGVSYQEIAKAGGGILSTVRETRKISPKKLQELSQERVTEFARQGVTTLEIKTGYALDLKNELKCLKVIQKLKGPKIVSTFLGPHSVPREFSSAKDYLEELKQWLPKIRKLSSRMDIWIEKGFFEKEVSRSYLELGKKLGFKIVIHADQLSLSGGSDLAIELGALSADHVIKINDEIIQKFAESETTAVLLPAADLYMKCDYPPARRLIDAGACVALATDFNPGTCPTQDLALVGLLARLEMKMSLPEVIAAYTLGAAKALSCAENLGALTVGRRADFNLFSHDWTELFYSVGSLSPRKTFIAGKEIKLNRH